VIAKAAPSIRTPQGKGTAEARGDVHLVGADAAGLLGRHVAVQQLLAGVVRGAPVVGRRDACGGRRICAHSVDTRSDPGKQS